MLTPDQIIAVIMLLNAFGVPPATVEYVRVQISAPQTQAIAPAIIPATQAPIIPPASNETVPAPLIAELPALQCDITTRWENSNSTNPLTQNLWRTTFLFTKGAAVNINEDGEDKGAMTSSSQYGNGSILERLIGERTYTMTVTKDGYATTTCRAIANLYYE